MSDATGQSTSKACGFRIPAPPAGTFTAVELRAIKAAQAERIAAGTQQVGE